jgi:hypothetical protein
MNTLFPLIAKAWKAFVAQKKLLPLIVLIDLLFVYGLTRLHYEVFRRATENLSRLTLMISEAATDMAALQSQEFLTLYHEVLRSLGIFFGIAFLLWLVAKGLAWFLAQRTVNKKIDALRFAQGFALLTPLWFILFLGLIALALAILHYAFFGVFPFIGPQTANVLAGILFWLFAYVVFISYSLLPRPAFTQALVLAVKQWKLLLPVHIIGSLIVFVGVMTPTYLFLTQPYVALAIAIFIALPAMAWARVLWIIAVQRVMRHA